MEICKTAHLTNATKTFVNIVPWLCLYTTQFLRKLWRIQLDIWWISIYPCNKLFNWKMITFWPQYFIKKLNEFYEKIQWSWTCIYLSFVSWIILDMCWYKLKIKQNYDINVNAYHFNDHILIFHSFWWQFVIC